MHKKTKCCSYSIGDTGGLNNFHFVRHCTPRLLYQVLLTKIEIFTSIHIY